LVNIPTLQHIFNEKMKSSKLCELLDSRGQFKATRTVRKPALGRANKAEQVSQKHLKELSMLKPYRKPTQVGWRKYAKVNERNFVKELGKKAGVTFG
jgi:hypothetical protein